MTKILPCTCQHPYQDGKYGPGLRVYNSMGKAKGKGAAMEWRCTICIATKGA